MKYIFRGILRVLLCLWSRFLEGIQWCCWTPTALQGRLRVPSDSLAARYFNVAYITALMVCMRFSASWNTRDCADSKTSSVTSKIGRAHV